MDGKGRWRDNVFVERVWKSIKYEEVYPSVITLKPAIDYHFKTGQRDRPKT
jgi:putative transposase